MITLTTPIAIPNINRLRVRNVQIDQDLSTAYVQVVAQLVGGNIFGVFQLIVINGSSSGLRANPAPTSAADVVQAFAVSTPTGFDAVRDAFITGAGGLPAKNQAVETACIAAGLLPAGTVS